MSARVAALLLAASLYALPVAAADGEINAARALEQAASGQLTIVDVRTPDEWRQTGVAPGAKRVDMHMAGGAPAFLDGILQAVGGDRAAPIALICRTGNRSAKAAAYLRSQGFTHVEDIGEGMAGSAKGQGWLKRGLPVEKCNC
jgi:rhodanese-related sulfurtransferase